MIPCLLVLPLSAHLSLRHLLRLRPYQLNVQWIWNPIHGGWNYLPNGATVTAVMANTWGMTPPWYLWDGYPMPADLPFPGIGSIDGRPWFPEDPAATTPYTPFDPFILLQHVLEEGYVLPFLRDPRGGDMNGNASTKHVFHWDLSVLAIT